MSENSLYIENYKRFKNQEIILYHHLGLGDMIICNGLVNKLSENFKKINLIIDKKFHKQADFLYRENPTVEIVSAPLEAVNTLHDFVEKFAKDNELKILKIGWTDSGKPFYYDFYKLVKFPYRFSYKYFYFPKNEKLENELMDYLIKYYKVDSSNYVLVHKDASNESYDLKIKSKQIIYVDKETDIFNNIFLYSKLIKDASEVHCVNSSFLHLVDRVDTNAKLIYHDVRGSIIKCKKKWNIKYYENKN